MVKIYLTLFIWVLEFNVNWDSKIFKYCCNIPPPPLVNTNETQILITWIDLKVFLYIAEYLQESQERLENYPQYLEGHLKIQKEKLIVSYCW